MRRSLKHQLIRRNGTNSMDERASTDIVALLEDGTWEEQSDLFEPASQESSLIVPKRRGIGSHHSPKAKTETWLTPEDLLRSLGEFDLDPCAAPSPRPWATAKEHYEFPMQDGLMLPWKGRVWMNPPYGKALGTWLAKLAAHGQGTSLIFARTDTDAFFDYVWKEADAVLFLRGRLHFHLPDGTRAPNNSGGPSCLVAYGSKDVEHLLDSGLDGAFVPLKRPVMVKLALEADMNVPAPKWRELVRKAMMDMGGEAALQDLYAALRDHPKVQSNPHYRAKIRQTVSRMQLTRVEEGRYAMAV